MLVGGVVHEKGLLPQACEWRTFAFTLLWLFCICAFRYNVIKSVISSCFSLLFVVCLSIFLENLDSEQGDLVSSSVDIRAQAACGIVPEMKHHTR